MPSQQKALLLESECGPLVLRDIGIPKPGPGKLLVRIEAAALNPADWKIQTYGILAQEYPCILGFDAAGTVVEVGSGVNGYAVDDRVILQGWWQDPADQSGLGLRGTFQQYIAVPVDSASKYPHNLLSPEEAATVPSGLATAALSLYNLKEGAASVRLTPPWEEQGRGKYTGKPIFILGGASSVGQYAIQLARLSRFSPIITTASKQNTELLKSLGATHILDRKLPGEILSKQAMEIAGGYFDVVFDAISVSETLAAGYSVTAPTGDLVVVLPGPVPGADERSQKKIHMAYGYLKDPVNEAASRSLLAKLPQLLERGDIKPNRAEVLSGGLRAVPGGLERLRNNAVSGAKLVVKPQETESG
ncbi:GroES-like protein [Pilatotrama ljubarskyi]|nr:GroES-like protein [Pilatotrama ljubarskyi]